MTLNLAGGYFDESTFGHSGMNGPDLIQNAGKAVLYVFNPFANQFTDVALRPLMYNFDENFLGTVQEMTDLATRGTTRAPVLIEELRSQNNLNDYMTTSAQSDMLLQTSRLSDRYRFILILTEKASGLMSGNTVLGSMPNSQTRRIYTGYFEDEPFNPTTFSNTKKTLNPNCFMVITHKTVVGTSTEHGRFGSSSRIDMRSSEEIIHSGISNSLIAHRNTYGDNRLFLMTPANCLNSVETTSDGFSLAVPGAHSDITRDHGANVVADLLEMPSQNVSQIVRGIVLHQDEISTRGRLSINKNDMFFDQSFEHEGAQRMSLAARMSLPRSRMVSEFDLNIDERISPVDLSAMVSGDLDVIPFDLPRPAYYETSDQQETSYTNQFSFLIATVIAPILNSAGLNAMEFIYEVVNIRGMVEYNFRTINAEPNWPVPDLDKIAMAKAVEYELHNGIFKTIFQSLGDFHVMVRANVTGMTTLRLNLVGAGMHNPVDFELPSFLGGMITPLLGSTTTNAHNSEAIESLYGIASGMTVGSGNSQIPDHFEKYANSGDWGNQGHNTGAFEDGIGEVVEMD